MNELHLVVDGLLSALITASLAGAILATVVLAIQRLAPRVVSPRFAYVLWALVALRLITPWCPESQFSCLHIVPSISSHGTKLKPTTENVRIVYSKTHSMPNDARNTSKNRQVQVRGNTDSNYFTVNNLLVLIWVAGGCGIFSIAIVQSWLTIRLTRKVDQNIPDWIERLYLECVARLKIRQDISLRVTDILRVPALVGLRRPQILLPRWCVQALNEDEIRFILTHELIHAKRFDVHVQFAVSVIRIIHWFDPFAWLMQKRISQLHELSCDAAVIRTLDDRPSIARNYGEALLKIAERCSAPANKLGPSFGYVGVLRSDIYNSFLHERILMLTKKAKKSWTVSVVAPLLLIGFGLCGFTVAQSPDNKTADERVTPRTRLPILAHPIKELDDNPVRGSYPSDFEKAVELEVDQENPIAYKIALYEGRIDDVTAFAEAFGYRDAKVDFEGATIFRLDGYTPEAGNRVADDLGLKVVPMWLISKPGISAEMFTGIEVPFADVKTDENGKEVPDVKMELIGFKFSVQSREFENGILASFIDIEDSRLGREEDGIAIRKSALGDWIRRPQILRNQIQTTVRLQFGVPSGFMTHKLGFDTNSEKTSRLIVIVPDRAANVVKQLTK